MLRTEEVKRRKVKAQRHIKSTKAQKIYSPSNSTRTANVLDSRDTKLQNKVSALLELIFLTRDIIKHRYLTS